MSRGQHRARRTSFFRRPPRGNPSQRPGRHTTEHVEAHRAAAEVMTALGQPADGMAPVGHAGRQTLAQLYAGDPDRGDRNGTDQAKFHARA